MGPLTAVFHMKQAGWRRMVYRDGGAWWLTISLVFFCLVCGLFTGQSGVNNGLRFANKLLLTVCSVREVFATPSPVA